jgi:hypothetical protein
VLSLAKLYDMAWCTELTFEAAHLQTPHLLRWLRKCQCPWRLGSVGAVAISRDNVEVLQYMRSSTDSTAWEDSRNDRSIWHAGFCKAFRVAAWLRADGAQWPVSFYDIFCDDSVSVEEHHYYSQCWPLQTVQWALSRGCTWGTWQCSMLSEDNFYCSCTHADHSDSLQYQTGCQVYNAAQLFAWAHEHGCPCTCAADAVAAAAAAASAVAAAAVEAAAEAAVEEAV